MKIFTDELFLSLSDRALKNPRKRLHLNIHQSYKDACQRLFNAIEPGSYIRPHRHVSDPKEELLIAIRGSMALITFDDQGHVTCILRFGSQNHGSDFAAGAEVAFGTWHTVVALEPGSVLLEVKAGPFDPNQLKDLAPWAPEEGSEAAAEYFNRLLERVAE
jgi:cupin fold WbuC family metalloprotein